MKYLNIFFIVLFVLSAAVQYNDPDPYIWMPLYLFGAFLCWQAIRGIYKRSLYIAGLLIYGGYALFLFFTKNGVMDWASKHEAESIVSSMKATKPWIEDTREFFGLLILIVALLVNMIWQSRKRAAVRGSRGSHT